MHLSLAEPAAPDEFFLKPAGAPWTYLSLVVAAVVAPTVEHLADAMRRPARSAGRRQRKPELRQAG